MFTKHYRKLNQNSGRTPAIFKLAIYQRFQLKYKLY